MKICILSMQNVPNFGSLLQSYSLKKILENQGHQVDFIDIKRNEEDDALLSDARLNYASECENGTGTLSKFKKLDRYFLNRIKIKYKSQKQDELFDAFRREFLGIKKDNSEVRYDACVIGSDEVFNCLVSTAWGFTSQLFGNVDQAEHVITYAASCGATTYDKLPPAVRTKIHEAFENVEAFSVRDENTKHFVQALSDKEVQTHLDPVVVGNFDEEIAKCNLTGKLPKHYCIVYSYYNRIHQPDEIKAILDFCKAHKSKPIAIGAPQKWISNYPVLSPFEVLAAFKNADFVITDTFHGTIFAAKYSARFAAMIRPSNRNKLLDLIKKLKVESHLIESMSDLEMHLQQKSI